MRNELKGKQMQQEKHTRPLDIPEIMRRKFTLIELLVVIAIIAIVVASKVGFFLQFSAIFAFKAL